MQITPQILLTSASLLSVSIAASYIRRFGCGSKFWNELLLFLLECETVPGGRVKAVCSNLGGFPRAGSGLQAEGLVIKRVAHAPENRP